MNSLPIKARFFILAVCFLGNIALIGQLRGNLEIRIGPVLLTCCVAAALLQIFKIEGATARSSYNLSWIVYGFAFINLGPSSTVIVMLVAHLFEWAWYRYAWYIQVFNIAAFGLALALAAFIVELAVTIQASAPQYAGSILSKAQHAGIESTILINQR